MEGYIYLILDGEFFKIGVAKNVIKRKKGLQTGNPYDLTILKTHKSKNPFKVEKMLHMYYHKNRVNGEWFDLSLNEVKEFLDVCQKYEDIVELLVEENPFFGKKHKF